MNELNAMSRAGAARIADLWFPGSAKSPRLTSIPGYESLLDRALQANAGLGEAFVRCAELAGAVEVLTPEIVSEWPTDIVEAAWFFLTCTYYMSSEAREAVGYPGQHRAPVALATADQLVDEELLAPVRAMGATYVPTPTAE